MSEAVLGIKKWGNSLGVRLPSAVVKAAGLRLDQHVSVRVEDQQVIISPLPENELSLEQRLALFDPERHRGEAMAAQAIGAERW
ncbi:AbrB/MazE/SpoVT family DNA-binding domain-containing protein [Desulfonatronovibrio magnus]|uniref:AbrB/MazE/SpoVT family DNA-binding domain-containing protein n=1 Tax=Desulfonatronovibrio magnus TaxID=698827 RepID=UPI0005EAF333|nr:AbrB/MazE/SpoVT family DNA-binding domain-containing protein [Desulfonatronovibrio magnus]